MDGIGIFTIIACVIGIIDFVICFVVMLKIISLFPKDAKISRYWKIAFSLVALFTIGYIVAIVSISLDFEIINQIMTPIVYVFGSLFVLIMVLLSLRTYKMIIK
jgi:hypothetical protein